MAVLRHESRHRIDALPRWGAYMGTAGDENFERISKQTIEIIAPAYINKTSNKMYLLGYDIGSSSIKAALVSVETGEKIAVVQSPAKEDGHPCPKIGLGRTTP